MKLHFTRTFAFCLVLVMCLSFFACTETPEETKSHEETQAPIAESDSESQTELEETDPPETEVTDGVPDLNFGQTVSFLYWSDVEKLEFVPGSGGEWDQSDIIQSSLYARNEAVERRLGITLDFIGEEGNTKKVNQFVQTVQNDYEGDQQFDIIAAYSRTAGALAVRGYLRQLQDTKYIDLSKPWYPELLHKNISISDKLYFVSGDASVNTLYLMYTIYFNKDIAEIRGIEDPYELVINEKWTIDKLMEMSQGLYDNVDGDDMTVQDVDDAYGFCSLYYHVDAFYTGSGYMLVDNKGSSLKISDDYVSEGAVNLCEKLARWFSTEDCNAYLKNSSDFRQPFVRGNALFCQERCYLAENYLIGKDGAEGVDFNYGVLPTPMLDEYQDDYITVLGNPFTLYGIARGSKDSELDMNSAVIEVWSYESYSRTTPALFEITMQLKYAHDSNDSKMFDICKRTITSDLGRIFSTDLEYMSEKWSKAACGNQNWEMVGKPIIGGLSGKLEEVVGSFTSQQ